MAAMAASSPPDRPRQQHHRSRSMATNLSSSFSSRPRDDDSRTTNTSFADRRTSVSSSSSTARRPRHQRSGQTGSHSSRASSRAPSTSSMVLTPGPHDPDFEAAFTPSGTDGDSEDNDAASTSAATLRPLQVSSARRSMRMSLNRQANSSSFTANCPPDCRCSDRDVKLGRCSRGLTRVTTSPSSDGDSDAAPTAASEHASQSQENTPLARSSLRSSRAGDLRSSLGSTSGELLRKPVSHIIDSSSESDAAAGQRQDDNDSQTTLRSALGRHPSYHRHRSSRSGSQSLAIESDTRSNTSDDHKRRRREERDRLIRQRIEQKRLARTSASTPGLPPISSDQDPTPSSETSLGGSHHRERSFNEDLSRLHRISHPPSATSIASFAAHVSPSKSEARRAALQRALQASQSSQGQSADADVSVARSSHASSVGLDLPPLPASANGEDRSSTSLLQEGIRLLNKEQLANRRESLKMDLPEEENAQSSHVHLSPPADGSSLSSRDPTPSPTGFSFTPQRMLKTASPPSSSSSNGESPRRAAHRRSRGTSGVVSLNARLPPANSSEARRRLAEVLQSPNLEVLPARSVEPEDDLTARKLQQAVVEHDPLADEGKSSSDAEAPKKGRKSVRFSPTMEYLEPTGHIEHFSSDEEHGWEVEDGRDATEDDVTSLSKSGQPTLSEETDQINLDEALEKIQSQEDQPQTGVAAETSSVAASAQSTSTPVRNPPSAFRSPASPKSADDRHGFAAHVLRRISKTDASLQGAATTPNRSVVSSVGGTPMMPGGLRFSPALKKQGTKLLLKGPLSPPLRKPRGLHLDRGLPPSYSAVTSGHTPMTLSTSIDSNLDAVGEEVEELEDGEQQVAATPLVSSDDQPASSDIDVGDESIWHDDNDGDEHGEDFQPPRESTPPPSASPSRSMHGKNEGGDRSNLSLRNQSFASSINLNRIDSAPPSPATSMPGQQSQDIELLTEGPSVGAEFQGDDSLRMTLEKVVEVLQGRVQTRQDSQTVAEAERTQEQSSASSPPPESSGDDKEAGGDKDLDLKEMWSLKLQELKVEEEKFEATQAQWGDTDLQQLSRLQATRQMLQSGIEMLEHGTSLPRTQDEHATTGLFSRRVRAALSLALVQALLLWLALMAIRHGSEHLYRTVYNDPFYPHIYDASSMRREAALFSQMSSETSPLGMLRAPATTPMAWVLDLSWTPRLAAARALPASFGDWTAILRYIKLIPSAIVRALLGALIDTDYNTTQRGASGNVAFPHSQRVHASAPL